jgi:hypothetical protein
MDDEVNLENAVLLIPDSWGIYIPQKFAEGIEFEQLSLSENFRSDYEAIAAGPDFDWYWEGWTAILDNATLTGKSENNKGKKYRLHQDGDLWAIPVEEA